VQLCLVQIRRMADDAARRGEQLNEAPVAQGESRGDGGFVFFSFDLRAPHSGGLGRVQRARFEALENTALRCSVSGVTLANAAERMLLAQVVAAAIGGPPSLDTPRAPGLVVEPHTLGCPEGQRQGSR
jgi:hypothetical protein